MAGVLLVADGFKFAFPAGKMWNVRNCRECLDGTCKTNNKNKKRRGTLYHVLPVRNPPRHIP